MFNCLLSKVCCIRLIGLSLSLLDTVLVKQTATGCCSKQFALNNKEGLFHFHYKPGDVGTSDSQLSADSNATGNHKGIPISDLKYATTQDRLITSGDVKAPHHIDP